MRTGPYFTPKTFRFLRELARNNDREWFAVHKERYEAVVREPALAFIVDFAPHLEAVSPHFRADPRRNGGSLFRIHRDTRFSRDKSPYKTHVGIQFRHERAKDAHAPGFYLHLEPGGCFMGVGSWHPDATALRKIREAIAEKPEAWRRLLGGRSFRERFSLAGDRLKRPPRGFDPEHPCVEDLKRKDFIALAPLTERQVTGAGFPDEFAGYCKAGAPLVSFLCAALELPF